MSKRPSNWEALAATVSDLRSIAAWTLVVFGGIVFLGTIRALSRFDATAIALFFLTVGFIMGSLFVHPRFGPQLTREYPLTEFGRTRSVDRRVLYPNEGQSKQCVMCDTRTRKGVVRWYREEFVLAGVPIYTLSEGKNHYCPDCAASDSAHNADEHSRATESMTERT